MHKIQPKKVKPPKDDLRKPEMMDSVKILAFQFLREKNLNKVTGMLKETILTSYLNGKGARIKTDEGYYIFIPNDVQFDTVCPHCGGEMSLDLKEMASSRETMTEQLPNEQFESKLMQDARRWNKSHTQKVPYDFIKWLEGK